MCVKLVVYKNYNSEFLCTVKPHKLLSTVHSLIRYSRKVPVILIFFKKNEFPRQSFTKFSNIKFHGTPTSDSLIVRCRRTDGHGEGNSCFSQLYERT